LLKNSILGGAALSALRLKPSFSVRALAPEVRSEGFSANCLAAVVAFGQLDDFFCSFFLHDAL